MTMREQLFRPGDLVFDIGAHCGTNLDKYITNGQAGCVVAVEPSLTTFLDLRLNAAPYGKKVHTIHAAAYSSHSYIELFSAIEQTGLSTSYKEQWQQIYPGIRYQPPQLVVAVTVASLAEFFGHPSFIKIDVEGGELHVLRGFGPVRPLAFTLEHHGLCREQTAMCLAMADEYGYTHVRFIPDEFDVVVQPAVFSGTVTDAITFVRETEHMWGNLLVER